MRTSNTIPPSQTAQPGRDLSGPRAAGDTTRSPPRSGYGFVECAINNVLAHVPPSLVDDLEAAHRHGGNSGYPATNMLAVYLLKFLLNYPYANGYLDDLSRDDRLLAICGLEDAPSESAYSRFKKKLSAHRETIDGITAAVFKECGSEIERLRELGQVPADLPPLGYSLTMDSTDVLAWARPGRISRTTGEEIPSKDPTARWGHRTAKSRRVSQQSAGKRRKTKRVKSEKSDDDKGEMYFGYKTNVIVDSNYGLPLYAVTRPANASDMVVMIEDLDACLRLYQMVPRYFLADKGYDSLANILHLVNSGIIPVIAIRRPPKDENGRRLYDGIYDEDGRPVCLGGQPMEYVESYIEKGHLFRCPESGCHLKDKVRFTRYCDDEHYEQLEGKSLRIIGLLPRCTDEYQRELAKRVIIERGFSSGKHSRLLDTHRYLNDAKVELHVAMSILSYLATALAHLKANDFAHMRHMRIRLSRRRRSRKRDPTNEEGAQSEHEDALPLVA